MGNNSNRHPLSDISGYRDEDVTNVESPYAQVPFREPLKIEKGTTASFVLYTSSLCGLAIRGESKQRLGDEVSLMNSA